MAKKLVIVESPAKAKTIGKFLGSQYKIKASNGHIRDLPKTKMGVDVDNQYKVKYYINRGKSKVIKSLRQATKKADEVYLASDHDREGEAIAWHLKEVLKKEIKDKDIYRIIFNEITKSAIKKAVKNPTHIDEKKVESQETRRILDRLVGYSVSPMLWRVIAKGLSAGRVQSVALRIICEREKEIEAFVPEEYWHIDAFLKKDDKDSFKARLKKWNGKTIKVKNKQQAEEIVAELEKNKFIITNIDKKKKKIYPKPAYITSTMQQDASRLLRFSPKRTMQVAQKLYEGIDMKGETVGLISYMRTDSLRISNEAIKSCRSLVKDRFGKEKLYKLVRRFKNKSSAQDAHEAIRPTDAFRTPEVMSKYLDKSQLKLYTLIWQRFVATQMNPVLLDTVKLAIENGKGLFETKGSTVLDKGFMEAYPHTYLFQGEKIDKAYTEKDELEVEKLEKNQKFTQPPPRYREATLIKELEKKGIGRPSTYAVITNTIKHRKYVLLKKGLFYATELGLAVNKFLVKNFDSFFNEEFTAQMEANLDKIEYNKTNLVDVLDKYYNSLVKLMEKVDTKKAKQDFIEETDIKCEKCGNKMLIRWGKNGRFLACSNFPKCRNTKNFEKTKEGEIKVAKPKTLDEKCPDCGGDLVLKSGRRGRFVACSNFPKCKFTKPYSLKIKCPECKTGEIIEKTSRKGKRFYSCSNYPDCKFSTKYKPVDIKCEKCGFHYLEERVTKDKKKYKKCPDCGKKYY